MAMLEVKNLEAGHYGVIQAIKGIFEVNEGEVRCIDRLNHWKDHNVADHHRNASSRKPERLFWRAKIE